MRMHDKFSDFHSRWVEEHVTDEQDEATTEELMGHIDGLKPCTTRCFRNNKQTEPPYYLYNRFQVKYDKEDADSEQNPPSPDDSTSMDCS